MMCLNKHNGKTITLGELLNGIKNTVNSDSKIYIPMYQRNYKWNQVTAVKLIKDLLVAYETKKSKSISLFTLYIDDKNSIQIVDGQQRMITLLLLFGALGKAEEFINLEFERDFSLNNTTRSYFIDNIQINNTQNIDNERISLTDKRRLLYNYQGIKSALDNYQLLDKNVFVNYLKKKVVILLHITNDEPVSEFLNLNCNKTKFSICDRVRSVLITYPTFNDINARDKKIIASILDCSDYKKGISVLFEEITRLLYKEDIYSTVKLGYIDPDKTNENRMNIMFGNLINSTENGYMNFESVDDIDRIKLLLKLAYYKKILKELEDDCKTYQTHRAFINFYKYRKINFFELLDNYVNNQSKDNLYDILHKEHSIDKHIVDYIYSNPSADDIYFVNSYFEVLSNNNKPKESDNYSSLLKTHFKNQSKDKLKYFSLNKDTFEDIVHSSGKYILYRYINEKHKENENIINFPPVLSLEEQQNRDSNDNIVPELKEIKISELLNKNITIPVIQRDYCMGSHFNQKDKSDMFDYIIDSFVKNKDITLSAITILPGENNIYVYDGQQRIVTLACLVKLLNSKYEIKKIYFEHRDYFNNFIKELFENNILKSDSYASKSVTNLKKTLEEKLKARAIDKDELCTYILEKIKLDVITVNGKLSTAEQFFVEINDGVQLVPYEIFKCKINARFKKLITCDKELNENCNGCDIQDCPSIDKSLYEKWISSIDNEWLDYFYRLNETLLTNEAASEELMEIRFIEFCCRMIYWEKYLDNKSCKHPLELKSFEKTGNEMGNMDIFIEMLTINDFERINEIMSRLILFKKNLNAVSCIEKDCGNDGVRGFSHYNPDKYDKDYLIERFLDSLKDDKIDYHDVVIWGILNGYHAGIIKDLMNYWNNKKVNRNSFAVLYPRFIGVWHHICLSIPKCYTGESYDCIEKALDRERIDDIGKEYDDVMKHLCLKNNNGTLSVQWGCNSLRYAKKWNDVVNIVTSDVFYYRTGSSTPEKIENKKVVSCNGSPNYVILVNADNKHIYCALATRYENSSRFMKLGWDAIEITETGTQCYQVTIQTNTKNYTLTRIIQLLK